MSDSQNNAANSESPMDDYGIRNDEMIEIASNLTRRMWVLSQQQNLSPRDIKDISMGLENVWNVVNDILSIDESIRDQLGHDDTDPEDPD